MNNILKTTATALAVATGLSTANAAEVMVSADITTSTTWTADNTYNLQQQIFVKNGATLTIEAGTVIASTTDLGGSLAVSRGSKIYIQGTVAEPVIMTSQADVATWIGGDPTTGTWREAANEWGNLTLMGQGFISEDATAGNTPVPSASNVGAMEGLVAAFPGDPDVLYGGGDDDDNSGSINYLSLRYGGKVIGLNNELNGLSLGGIGRGTDISHVEVMNNVDDGVEIWGGAVELDHISVWNIGDDSFDIDQGFRGKAQFVFIVQGYSVDAKQGSGVGDNAFETDGAEDSDWQPVTTTTIYNATVVGQPVAGDRLTAWRDNARVQYRNCIFMDGGEEVVGLDNVDGDGANGYGHNGTLTWAQTWTTPYTTTSTVNAPANPADFYKTQTSGNLAEIKDSVFFRNQNASAYTEANNVGVFDAANNNVQIAAIDDASAPIQHLTRGPAVTKGTKLMVPVTLIDPRPMNEALVSVGAADPADGFWTAANYRGAFSPTENWLCGWSAADAFGFLKLDATATVRNDSLGWNIQNSLSATGVPSLGNAGFALVADPVNHCGDVGVGSIVFTAVAATGAIELPLPGWGCNGGFGNLLVGPSFFQSLIGIYAGAPVNQPLPIPAVASFCGIEIQAQVAFVTPAGDIRLGSAVDMQLGN